MDSRTVCNRITLRGTIIATRITSKKRAIYTIATDGDKGSSVFPEVVHLVEYPKEAWHVGDHVTAICHAKSGKITAENGEAIYFDQIVADYVFKTERILSNYFDDISEEGSVPADINEFVFCGEVYRVIENPGGRNVILVTLKIPEDDSYYNFVEIAGFKHEGKVMKDAEPGDMMAIAGAIRTIRQGHKTKFDYVAKDTYLEKKKISITI